MTHDSDSDESQIRALIGAHFDALKWSPGSNPDWKTFSQPISFPWRSYFPPPGPCRQSRSTSSSNA